MLILLAERWCHCMGCRHSGITSHPPNPRLAWLILSEVVQYRWWHVPPHFWAISVLLFSGMVRSPSSADRPYVLTKLRFQANLWRYRRWGRRVCYHQYYCIVQRTFNLLFGRTLVTHCWVTCISARTSGFECASSCGLSSLF